MVVKKRGMFWVVLVSFLLVFLAYSTLAQVSGCYIYPKGSEDVYCVKGILDTEAQVDCSEHKDCSMDQHFVPGSDCSEFPACQEITCSADCQIHARGVCEQLAGSEVPPNEFSYWCSPGCCNIPAKNFCQFNLNKFQCDDRTAKFGVSLQERIYNNELGMNTDKCNQLCNIEVVKASLSGVVKDQDGKPLENADFSLEGTGLQKKTDPSGSYAFELNPGTYLIKVVLSGYLPASLSITLQPGEKAAKDIVLVKAAGVGSIQGEVLDQNNLPLAGATISRSGPASGQDKTNEAGKYVISNLPVGKYTITASKLDFLPQKKEITVGEGAVTVNFQLASAGFQGIKGKTCIDDNKNKKCDAKEEINGAKLYVDNVFKGYSKFSPTGEYQFSLPIGEHTILATHQDYSSGSVKFTVLGGKSVIMDLPLTKFIGECTFPNPPKDVAKLSASHVRGKEQVLLQWAKPCPEVLSYTITRSQGKEAESFPVSSAETSKIDAKVKWGETYKYEIIAVYDKYDSKKPAAVAITLGDQECEERYSESTGWDLFCRTEAKARKSIWSCNDQNKLVVSKDCSASDGVVDGEAQVWFCAQIGEHNAICKDAGICSAQAPQQNADPFGLYYTRDQCYGSDEPEKEGAANYCYYDYSNTVVNQCSRCDSLTSCFDYKSKDACEINNCLGAECQWVDSAAANPLLDYSKLFSGLNIPTTATSETGTGYCVEKDYDDDDKCSLCGPKGSLFENYFCTDQVCSSLGECFSNSVTKDKPLKYCASCGDAPNSDTNCYSYQFESECSGGQNLEKNDRQEFVLSADQCGWGRCVWDGLKGGPGTCMKDGDGNGKDDCASFANAGDRINCRVDNTAPNTKVVSKGQAILSIATPNITFQSKDAGSPLGVVGFCLASAAPGSPEICTNFKEKPYPGKLRDETVAVNLMEALQKEISGETYALKFYSKDKFLNQENVQTAFVYVDNVPPQFEINQEIKTVGDKTSLSVYLDGTNEPMECSFVVQQILPAGGAQAKTVDRIVQKKEALFKDLQGVKQELTVTCEDNQGNKNTQKKAYTFDLQEKIKVVQPELYGSVSSANVAFEVETVAGASCGLYLSATNQKVADFISDENGKKHKTNPVLGFIEREYAGEYKVICTELFGGKTYEDFFHFTVDFSAPGTDIILKEGARTVKPKAYGWEEFFVRSALVDFECRKEGFQCDKTFYCLGEGCELINNMGYKEYARTISLNQSGRICYYSTDLAKNPVYQPACGTVRIEGYGLTLEKPPEHRYRDEKLGVSNINIFTLQFSTKVPTTECRFDFTSGFNYEAMPKYKVLNQNPDEKYLIENFPKSIFSEYPRNGGIKQLYVKCKNLEGDLGPEQKLVLEYDPTKPEIKSASATPRSIVDGITTQLSAETDDKTLCKYSDNSDGSGSSEYDTMEFSFPGAGEKKLDTLHQTTFNINFLGAKKEYVLNVQCKNGAGDLSEIKEIRFAVDYAALGGIAGITPSGYIKDKNATLKIETTKRAVCEYKQGLEYAAFQSGANTNLHSAPLGALQEKKYIIPVRCSMGDHIAEANAQFTVDVSPPVIQNVNDGSYTCGGSEMNVLVATTEENVSGYYYEVYDVGESKSLGLSSNRSLVGKSLSLGSPLGILVLNATVGPGLPIRVSTANLVEGHNYAVKVLVIDGAGNIAVSFAQGDGFTATSNSYSACQNDTGAPGVIVVINDSLPESCTSTPVELQCEDATGCSISYGKASSADLCQPVLAYNGQKVLFDASGWLCYAVKDSVRNNYSGSEKITLLDEDGDKVLDGCDQCPETAAGKVSDEIGCAAGQVPESERSKDSDKDGLPDIWERLYDEIGCEFNFISADSNADGVSDNLEDYDQDGYSSFEEYTKEFNPCAVDARPEEPFASEFGREREESIDALAWIFLLLGLLLVLGGIGYLIYYYKFAGVQRPARPVSTFRGAAPTVPTIQPRKLVESWAQKLALLGKEREERRKERARKAVFGEFSRESTAIPHLEPILRSTGDHLSKVGTLARKYVEHKEEIKPGLRREEKGLFGKLEQIAEQTKEKGIHEVLEKSEAKDIFEKLRQISKKRKE